jgi:hypothetical protein
MSCRESTACQSRTIKNIMKKQQTKDKEKMTEKKIKI